VAATSLGGVAVILILCSLVYLFQQAGQPETPTQPTLPAPGTAGGWYSLYFTEPTGSGDPSTYHGGMDEVLAASLAGAQQTIDIAAYEFNLMPVAEALAAAHARGLNVRLVTDTDSTADEGVRRVAEAGIPVVEDRRDPIMHDKFIVLDGASVWTGSMNFSVNDAYRNDNNIIYITSPRLAANYAAEFEEMFAGQFGPTSPDNTPNPQITIDGTTIENYFSSEGEVDTRLIQLIGGAIRSIDFMAFSFTSEPITQAILERASAGVQVRGVLEAQQAQGCCPQAYEPMRAAGLDVRLDGNIYRLHHKVIVIDGQIVITGSYNFSAAAEHSNDENVLILHNSAIASRYLAEFERVWGMAVSGD
jgi:phosphatidylserine/phosphatidylglycerophosphate/cardiolipin synthase-like enzyme